MATSLDVYAPFDSGTGSSVTEDTWRKFMRHMLGSQSGVIRGFPNEFSPSAAGSGMTVTVDTGEAWMRGHYGQSTALKTLAISTSHPTLARKDRIILRADFVNNRVEVDVLTGTAAASPAVSALTQNTSMWETSLGIVAVAAAATTISSGNVTDDRMYTSAQARYAKSSNQSTATTAYVKTTWDTTLSRSGDISFDSTNNQFTLLRSGLWAIKYQARWPANGTGKRELIIADPATVSGGTCTDLLAQQAGPGSAADESALSCFTIMRFPLNQIIAGFTFQSSGGALNVVGTSAHDTDISIVWLGP